MKGHSTLCACAHVCTLCVCVETVANIGMKIMVLLPVVVGDIEILFK